MTTPYRDLYPLPRASFYCDCTSAFATEADVDEEGNCCDCTEVYCCMEPDGEKNCSGIGVEVYPDCVYDICDDEEGTTD